MHLCVKNDVRQMPKRRASDTEHGARNPGPGARDSDWGRTRGRAAAPGWELRTHHHRHHYLFAAVCATHYMACRQGKQN